MKRLFIQVDKNKYEVDIHPGTTPRMVLDRLQLDEDYDLYRSSDPTTYFSEEEDLFPLVTHEELLLAQTIFEAEEAFLRHLAYGGSDMTDPTSFPGISDAISELADDHSAARKEQQ
jgi:hypothetical protein